MEKSILVIKGAMIITMILVIGGCASLGRNDCYDCYTEVVIVQVPVPYPRPYPVPYPDPGYIEENAPPPVRNTPLVRPRDPVQDTPRIKNPRGEKVAHSTPKRPSRKR